MTLEANVVFSEDLAEQLEKKRININVDVDYVSADQDEIVEWVRNELEEMFGCSFNDEDFKIKNLVDLVEDINSLCSDE